MLFAMYILPPRLILSTLSFAYTPGHRNSTLKNRENHFILYTNSLGTSSLTEKSLLFVDDTLLIFPVVET